MTTRYQKAAEALAKRMRVWRDLADRYGQIDSPVQLQPCELWEPSDEAALREFEEARAEITNGTPLPFHA